jgi:hypothetical protein
VFFSLLCVLIRRKPVGRQPLTLLLYEGTAIEGLIAPGALSDSTAIIIAGHQQNIRTPPQLKGFAFLCLHHSVNKKIRD